MRQLAIRKPNATRRLPEFLTHHRNNPNNHNNPFQVSSNFSVRLSDRCDPQPYQN